MQEILTQLSELKRGEDRVALATIVRTSGSVPRPAGSVMAVSTSGKVVGSISGGCLESDVVENAMEVLESGQPKVVHYGITEEMAFNVGLSCGGEVDIFIEPFDW